MATNSENHSNSTSKQKSIPTIDMDLKTIRSLLEGLNYPMFVVDVETKNIILTNQSAQAYTGLQDYIKSINIKELYEASCKQEPSSKSVLNEQPTINYSYKNNDGTEILLEIKVTPINLQGVKTIFGIVNNLSHCLEVEESLKQNIVLFQTLFDENTLPILLVEPNSFTITEANYYARDFLGLTLEQLRGTPFSSFSNIPNKRFNTILSDFMEKKYTGLELPIKTGKGSRDVSIHYTYAQIAWKQVLLLILVDVT